MAVALTPTLPPVFRRLVRQPGWGSGDPKTVEALERLGLGTLLTGWLLSLVGWALMALSYYATLRALGIEGLDPVADLPRYTAGVALAVVAGFLLLLLPGGVGVREAFLAELMVPYLEGLGRPDAASTAWASAPVASPGLGRGRGGRFGYHVFWRSRPGRRSKPTRPSTSDDPPNIPE